VGIFGGRGHFVVSTTPRKIEEIDAAIEFGGYLGISLGIASGYVYLFAGIRYRYLGKNDVYLGGYLVCAGGVTVFGFISVTVTFLLLMEYESIGGQSSLYGTASISYSIKIGFFKKSFTLSYSKRIAGASRTDRSDTSYIEPTADNLLTQKGGPSYTRETGMVNGFDDNKNDAKSFEAIYTPSLWNQYCQSFKF
jgi:hypothetical protein